MNLRNYSCLAHFGDTEYVKREMRDMLALSFCENFHFLGSFQRTKSVSFTKRLVKFSVLVEDTAEFVCAMTYLFHSSVVR
jgi:hypothetical protein